MKRTPKKLAFTRQTVRVLNNDELSVANGGGTITQTQVNCPVNTVTIVATRFCIPPTITANQSGCDSTITFTRTW